MENDAERNGSSVVTRELSSNQKNGTIAFETENLGRQLILVDWDRGLSTCAFANEIEVIDANEHPSWRS
jgi:hypothetical protein